MWMKYHGYKTINTKNKNKMSVMRKGKEEKNYFISFT